MNRRFSVALAALCLSYAFFAACADEPSKPAGDGPAPIAAFDFEPSSQPGCYVDKALACVSSNGPIAGKDSLLIDTRPSKGIWNQCWKTPEGLLKGGGDYVVSFKCKNVFVGPDSYALFLVRPFGADNDASDIAALSYDATGRLREFKMSFRIPEGRDDYSFQIHSRKAVAALIDDIQIRHGEPGRFIPASSNAPPPAELAIPTGCPEFEIEQPNPKRKLEVSVADFGADPSLPDNSKAFAAAIAKCKESGASKLSVPKGLYRFLSDEPLRFKALSDFEMDGGGSSFVFFKKRGALIEISDCSRTLFKDFSVDWDWERDPIGSVVRVESADTAGKYADLRFVDYETFPRRDVKLSALVEYDRANGRTSLRSDLKRHLFSNDKEAPALEWLSGNLLRAFFKNSLTPGSHFLFKQYYYEMPGFVMRSNAHLTLSGITLYSCPGSGFDVGGEQHHWQLLGVKIGRPDGSQRPLSSAADHCHVGQSRGYMKMIGCDFSYGGDDLLNIHDCSIFAFKSGAFSLTTKNAAGHVVSSVRPGDLLELREDDFSPAGYSSKVKSVAKRSQGVYDIALEIPLPEQKGDGFVVFNRSYGSNHVIVRDCKFHDASSRILLLADDVTVERNDFNRTGLIKIETGYTLNSWSEGYGASNIVIRDNILREVNSRANYKNEMSPAIYISAYLRSDPSNEKTSYPILRDILIEGNKFANCPGALVYACSAKNVIVRNNEIVNDIPLVNEQPRRGSVGAAHSSGIYLTGNRWMKSPCAPNPGLLYAPETTKDIFCWGNKVSGQ